MKAIAFVELDLHQILSSQWGTQPQIEKNEWGDTPLSFPCLVNIYAVNDNVQFVSTRVYTHLKIRAQTVQRWKSLRMESIPYTIGVYVF